MAERLKELDRTMDIRLNIYENRRRAEMYRLEAAAATNDGERLDLLRQFALEQLKSGDSREAIVTLKQVIELEDKLGVPDNENRRTTQMFLGTAWLRVGEQENCLTNHTTESCLLPIRDLGVHRLPEGSREALRVFQSILEKNPERLDARWLLNIAHMTLGEYPDKVPPQWRVPAERFASDHDIGRFQDVAGDLGLDVNDLSGGTILEDFNNDGFLDVMASAIGSKSQLRFFLNRGDGSFEERTEAAGLLGLTRGLNMIQGDYDNDGNVDVLVLRGAWLGRAGRIPNSLLRNNGDGTFSDVTVAAGVSTARPTQTAVFLDYDGDGWLDLCVGNETASNDRHRVELFRNNGDGTFTERAFESGLTLLGFVKGVASADYNNDGRPDLYFSTMSEDNRLFRNDGPGERPGEWKFTDVSAAAGVTEPQRGFPCWFFDYDNDGREDLLAAGFDLVQMDGTVAEILGLRSDGARLMLYRNRGDGTFEDVTSQMRLDHALLAMGSNFGDLDNDGWLDFYIGTGNPDFRALVPNKMFRNAGGKVFQDVTTSGGFGHVQKGHAIAFGDLDLDGDQDVYANMGGAFSGDVYRNVLFENPGHGNHWLKLKLVGVKSNRSAIGARIQVVATTPAGERAIHKTVNSGGSFGANPLRQEIGLGDATKIERVEIFWPATGQRQTFTGLALDAAYTITEGQDRAEPLALQPTPFKKGGAHAHHH